MIVLFGGGVGKAGGGAGGQTQGTCDDAFTKVAELAQYLLDVDGVVIDIRPVAAEHGLPHGASRAFRTAIDRFLPQGEIFRLADPIVAREHGFASYVGVPIRDGHGHVLGMLAAIDRQEREFDTRALATLRMLADIVWEGLSGRP